MATTTAMMTVELDSKKAQQGLDNLDSRLESVEKSSKKTSSSVSRLEKTFENIEDSVARAVGPMQQMQDLMGKMARVTVVRYHREMQKLHRENKQLSQTLADVRKHLSSVTRKMAESEARANGLANKLDRANRALDKTGKSFVVLGRDLSGLKDTFDKLNKSLKLNEYLFSILIQAVINFIQVNLVGYLIRVTDQFILLENRLRLVNDNLNTFNINMKAAGSIALETRQSLFAVGNLMARVGRNSQELAENSLALAQVTSTVSKSFQIAGATAEEARNAIVQLSQALASGRLQGDELRSILELAPTLAKSISKSIGITVGELRSFASEGMITTEIIVSAMLEATDEINESFAKMKPTISQAMEVVRTSMQLALGSTESVKNANTTLALSFIKLGGAIRKLIEGTGLGKLGDVLEKIAANIVPLVGSFVAFIGVFGTLTAATYAFGKALAFVQAMSKGNLVASLVKLSMVAASFFAASKTFDALGDKMKYLSNTTEDLAGVIRRSKREMEQLEEQSGEALDELQKISVVYRNISFEVSQVTLAIQELEKEQKKIENQMVSLEDKTKNTFRKIAYFIEAIIRGIFAGLNKIAIMTLQSIADSFLMAAEWMSYLDFTGTLTAGIQSLRSSTRQYFNDLKKQSDDAWDVFGGKWTDAMMGKEPMGMDQVAKDRIDAELAAEKSKLAELEAAQNKMRQERDKTAREQFMARFKAQIENAKRLVDIEASEMRRLFELQFSKPFDVRFIPGQESLAGFASSFASDLQKEIEKRVPEASVDLSKIFDLTGEGSPLNINNFYKEIAKTGKKIGPSFRLTEDEAKNIFNFKGIVDQILSDEAIAKKIKEVKDAGGVSILPDILGGTVESLLYKNIEKLTQDLIKTELAFSRKMEEFKQSSAEELKSLKLTERLNNRQIKVIKEHKGYRDLILDTVRLESELQNQITLERMALEGHTKAQLEEAKEILKTETETLVTLKEQEIALEAVRETRALEEEIQLSKRNIFLLNEEISLFKKAVSPIERAKKLQEERDKVEQNILYHSLKQKGYNEEQIKNVTDMLSKKQDQLNYEQEITKELEFQKELQKSKDDLLKEQVLNQVKAYKAQQLEGMSLSQQLKISAGMEADPLAGLEQDISKAFDIMVSQDIPAYMLTFKNGVLDVAEEYQKKLTDDEIIRVERARELIDIQNQINEEQKKFFNYTETWVDSINKKLGEFIGEKGREIGGRRTLSKGGLLSGPSHNNGGIGGYLNGQPIELEGGEYIINKKAVANYGIPLFDALNARKFQNGGMAAASYGKMPTKEEVSQANLGRMAYSIGSHQFEELNYSMEALKETTDELSKSNKTGIKSVDDLAEKYKDAPIYGQPGTGSPAGMTPETKLAIEQLTVAVEENTEAQPQKEEENKFLEYGKSIIDSVKLAFKDPTTAIMNLTFDSLMQNERFQKTLDRFMSIFMDVFGDFAEGIAIVFEALVDMVEPLRPLFEMMGGAVKQILRAFTQVIQPFARLIESLTPILIYLSGFLQLLVGLISGIFGIFADTLDQIFSGILNGLGIETSTDKYKSLNLLRQERDIIGEINNSIKGLADTLQDIEDVIFSIMNSALNISAPGVKLELASEKYNELYEAATRMGADEKAVEDYKNFTQVYLQQAQDVLKTSSAYQQIYVRVIEDLQSLQEASAKAVGADITEALKKGIFELQVAGSPMGDMLADAVNVYRNGFISYNDLLTYIGYKLAQIDDDIDLKEFADFGSIGDFREVEEAFYKYRDDAITQWESSMGEAISSSSVRTDFERLFGIDYETGQRIADAVALQESEMIVAIEEGRAAALRRVQPEIGDVTPQDVTFTREEGTTGFNLFDLGIDFDLFGNLGEALQLLWNNIIFGIETIWGELEGGLNQLITNLETGFQTIKTNWDNFLDMLGIPDLASWDNWVSMFEHWAAQLDIPGGLGDFKENWDQWTASLNLPDLSNWDSFKSWFDNLGLPDLSDIDLGIGLGDFQTEWNNLFSGLSLDGVNLNIGEQLQNAVNSVFGDPKSLLDKLQMLKNPFYPAIQPDYLIEFAKGGLLHGPSHQQGGILANVSGQGPIELEGGEYIINKKTVSGLGSDFFSMINGVKDKKSLSRMVSSMIPRFENGGNTSWNEGGYGGGNYGFKESMFDLTASQFERTDLVDYTNQITDLGSILDIRINNTNKESKKNNPEAPSSKTDPMRLIEPQSWLSTHDFFDARISTRGWFKSLFGNHGIETSMGFPYGMEFRNWETGGLIPRFENGGGTWSALEPSEIGSFRSFSGNKIPPEKMLARNRNGLVNETRRRDDLSTSNKYEKLNIDLSFLDSIGAPSFVGGMIKSAVDAIIGSGWALINGSIDLIGSFGANIGNYLTNISALGGMFGGGDASREQWSLGEIAVLGIGMASLVSSFLGMAEGRSVWGEDVGDWLEVLSFGNYKKTKGSLADITWAWIPAFLSLAPVLGKDSFLQYDDQYGKGSIWDWLSVTSDKFIRSLIRIRDKGGEDLSELGDDKLLGLLALYGAYEGAVNIFDLGLPSLFGSSRSNTSKPFSFFSNDSSSKSSIPAIPSFLSRGNTSSRYTSYKGFAKGGSVQSGGMAIGPSHQGGMIGLSPDGGPFLFEGGEYIFSKESVASIGKSNLDRMNFGKGGSIANEMFNISGRSANSDQIVLIADNVSIGSINSNKMDSYFDNKYMNDLLTGNFDTGYTSFGAGGGLRSFASGEAIGPSHQSGMLGMTSSGAPFLFEGGEYIINKDAVDSIGMDNLDLINQGILPMMFGSGGSLKSFRSAGPVKGSWMDTWGKELPKTPDYFDSSFAEDMDIFMTARSRSQRKRSSNFLLELMKPTKPTRFRDIFDPIFASLSLMSILGLGFPTKDGDSDFTKIEKGNYGDIAPINQIMLLSLLGYGGYRFHQWWKSGNSVFGDGGEIPSFRSGGDIVLLAGLLGGIGGNFLSDIFRGPGSYFGRPGDAGIFGGISGAASYMMLSSLFGTKTNNTDQTKALLLAGLLGYGSTPFDYSSSSMWSGYGRWDGVSGSEMGKGGSVPSFGLGGQLETIALLFALLGGYTGYKGSQLYGPWTGSTVGDVSLGFFGGLLPFFLGTNLEALRGKGGSVPSFGNGGSIPSFGIGDYLGWLWPGNWLPDGPKKGKVYHPFLATPYKGISGSSWLPWNWFDDDVKGPDTSTLARRDWYEALVYYGNIFNWFGKGGSIPEAGNGMGLFGFGTASIGAMSILADAGMLPGNAFFGSSLGSRQNKGSAGSQALTAAQAISWALGSIGLFSSMQGGKRSGEMGLLSLLLMGLGSTGFKSGGKSYLNPATWAGTQKYNRSKFGLGGSIPSFESGGKSNSGMRRFGDSPGLDLLSSLLMMGLFNELYQGQVKKGSGKNSTSSILQLIGLLGVGLSGYGTFKSLTSGNWMVGGMSGSLPYLLKDKPVFGSGGSIPSFGVGDWLFGEDTPRRKPNPGLDLLTSLILMSGSNQLYKEQVSKGSGKNNKSRLLQLLGLLGTGYFAYDSFKNLTSGNWMFGGKSGSLGYLSPKFGKGGKIPSLGLGNSPGLSLFGSLIGLALSNQIYREQVSKGSKKNNNSRLLQLLGLLGTGYFTYDSFKSLTSGNWMFGGKSGSLGYLLKDRAIFGSGGDIPSFADGRGVGSSNVLDWLWPWDTKGSIDSLFDWSSRGIANASMDFLDLGWWGRNFSLWSWLDFGNGGSIPSFKTAGSLLELLGKNRRKSAFERGFFEPSAMGDVSRSRVIPGRGKRNNSWGFLEYLMLTLGIGGLGAIISNNKKLFGFGTGGSLQAGGVARGPSHQSGMVGYAKGGMPFLFEGGEYIIRKDSVDKLGVPILDMLNSGMFSMGRGGRIPSYQTGTTVAPTNMMESLLLARRDLFGLQKITRTTDSGDIEEVYVANVSEISGGSSSNTELLSGISELLSSLLVTTKVQQKIIGENGLEIMEEQLKFSTLAVETAFGTQLALQDYTSNIFSVATEEQAKALTDAGIAPGMLLRVSLDFIGNAAFAQLASLLPRGGGPSFDDRLLDIIIKGALQYGIAEGGIGMTGAAIAALGLERGRSTAEEGKQDLSTAAGLAALVGLSAASAPAWVTVAATVIAAEVIGKPENYFAEIGFDEQMDLQEPVQGLYDELFNQNDGAFTYPAKYVDTLFKERIPDVQKRLDEGTMRMNMNSQKLASAMERAFDLDEGSLQFDAIGGLSETYGSVESLSKIGDRLKELENIVAPQVQELIEGIRYIVEYPAEFFKNFGNQLDKFFKGSLGELFSVIFGIPLQIADLFEKTLKQNIGIGLQEFTKNSLALFLAIAFFPVTLTMLATGKIGENVDKFLTNFVIFTGAIALLPVTLTMAIVAANSEFVVKFAESFNNTVLGGILNIPGNSLKAILDLLVPTFLGSFTGIFDSFLGEILMIPNMLLQETINFVTALPGRLLKMFGIEFPFFELNALKNPFHGNLGGPEYLIDLEIGEKSEGDGGLINYGRGGVLQTGGLAVGPSHQSGMLGLTNQGTPFLFEGGEYIVNKKTTDLLGHDFMAGINAVKSDEDLKDVFSVLSMFESGGDLFDLGMNDNPLSSVFTIPNPLKSLTGPDEFNISIDPSEDLSGIDVEQNLFKNGGGLFDIVGNVFGNSFEKDFLSVDNPFRKAITFVERYQREVKKYGFLGRVVGTVLEWATRTVTKLVPLGPDTLKLGIDGNSLDFYNSKLTSNFGGDVLNKLGIDSLPTPSMKNGGMVFGPSHGMGGVLAELEGGEYVMNRDSVSDLGYGFMSDLNSGGSGFTSSLIRTSSMNNQLLSRLIEVVEQKEMSVTVLDTSGEEKSDSNIRISRDREMNYRGARMLA